MYRDYHYGIGGIYAMLTTTLGYKKKKKNKRKQGIEHVHDHKKETKTNS